MQIYLKFRAQYAVKYAIKYGKICSTICRIPYFAYFIYICTPDFADVDIDLYCWYCYHCSNCYRYCFGLICRWVSVKLALQAFAACCELEFGFRSHSSLAHIMISRAFRVVYHDSDTPVTEYEDPIWCSPGAGSTRPQLEVTWHRVTVSCISGRCQWPGATCLRLSSIAQEHVPWLNSCLALPAPYQAPVALRLGNQSGHWVGPGNSCSFFLISGGIYTFQAHPLPGARPRGRSESAGRARAGDTQLCRDTRVPLAYRPQWQ